MPGLQRSGLQGQGLPQPLRPISGSVGRWFPVLPHRSISGLSIDAEWMGESETGEKYEALEAT